MPGDTARPDRWPSVSVRTLGPKSGFLRSNLLVNMFVSPFTRLERVKTLHELCHSDMTPSATSRRIGGILSKMRMSQSVSKERRSLVSGD